jgi:hypothetical protein
LSNEILIDTDFDKREEMKKETAWSIDDLQEITEKKQSSAPQ